MIVLNGFEQGTAEWAEARRGIATASCVSKIITPAKGELSSQARDYACQLIAESVVPPHYWIEAPDLNSPFVNHGITTEAEALKYFVFETGKHIRKVGFVKSDCGRFGCSPDALVLPAPDEKPSEGLELKCPAHKTHVKYLLDGGLPVEYRPQVHASLVVTGLARWNFMSYAIGLPPLIVTVEPDEYTEKVRKGLLAFWEMYQELKARIGVKDYAPPERREHPTVWGPDVDDKANELFSLNATVEA